MKNVLLLVLMLLLPLQASWSAAAVFCQHETTTGWHWGHHVHEVDCQQDSQQPQQNDTKSSASKAITAKTLSAKVMPSADISTKSMLEGGNDASKHKFNLGSHADHLNINQHVIKQQHATSTDFQQRVALLSFVALPAACYQSPVLEQPEPPLWPA